MHQLFRVIVSFGLAFSAWACTLRPSSTTLTVMAAAAFTDAFQEMAGIFEASHPQVDVVMNFASSRQLAQQLAGGAPADVFASANQQQIEAVVAAGRIEAGSAQIFARSRLVVIYPKNRPVALRELSDLARPGMKLVLAARELPAGQYSLEFLAKASRDPAFGAGFQEAVLKNVVSYEANVRAVLTKVSLGEADAGIVFFSDLASAAGQRVGWLEIPEALNVTGIFWIAVIEDSHEPGLAQEFVDLVLSAEGQAVLEKHGFFAAGAVN